MLLCLLPCILVQIRKSDFAASRIDAIHAGKAIFIQCSLGNGLSVGQGHLISFTGNWIAFLVDQFDFDPAFLLFLFLIGGFFVALFLTAHILSGRGVGSGIRRGGSRPEVQENWTRVQPADHCRY